MQTDDIYYYNCGSGIYNVDGLIQKHRTNVVISSQIKFNSSEIYDNLNNKTTTTRGLEFIYLKNQPNIPILFPDGKYFKSNASLIKYYKKNKQQIIDQYGKLDEDIFICSITFSHNDRRCI